MEVDGSLETAVAGEQDSLRASLRETFSVVDIQDIDFLHLPSELGESVVRKVDEPTVHGIADPGIPGYAPEPFIELGGQSENKKEMAAFTVSNPIPAQVN